MRGGYDVSCFECGASKPSDDVSEKKKFGTLRQMKLRVMLCSSPLLREAGANGLSMVEPRE